MNGLERTAAQIGPWVGRALLSIIFITSGWAKLTGWAGTVKMMGSTGLPLPEVLAAATILTEVGGGLLLLSGLRAFQAYRWAALVLALFLVPASVLFHNFWAFSGEAAHMQQIHFFKNLAIMGGLFYVAAVPAPATLPVEAPLRQRAVA